MVKIDLKLCVGCGTCVKKCPHKALSLKDQHAVVNPSLCVGCGLCTDYCSQEALTIETL
jgi:heterodisulfide reductase subunit A-like polyferredoxin